MKVHSIPSAQGVRLTIAEAGPPDGRPILFIHGWSQSHLSWTKQLKSQLAERYRLVALDLRGHGDSDKPRNGYGEPATWAGDVQAVIETLSLERPVLVGWSYAGLVINDYVRHYGQERVSGVCYVGAATDLGIETAYPFLGASWNGLLPSRPDSVSGTVFSEHDEEITKAMRMFLRGCFPHPLPAEDEMMMLGFNLQCPSRVRQALLTRSVCNDDVLSYLRLPVLVMHGDSDEVVRLDTGRHIASRARTSRLSVYEGMGHAPFWENAPRFNAELAEFVDAI